ncbi:MAG: helix-turn-helix transcriptional regulator [Kiritimatiellaeota bacterium]|nr:helix-turn-helix transcriptional regulator [Kiritimatiellota bacterium]
MKKSNRTSEIGLAGDAGKWNPVKGFVVKQIGHCTPQDQPVPLETATGSVQIIWCIKGDYKATAEGKCDYAISEGEVGVVFPCKHFALRVHAMPSEYCYLTIDGDDAQAESSSAGLWDGLTGKTAAPEDQLVRIARYLAGDTPTDCIAANITTRELLLSTAAQLREDATNVIAHECMYRINWRFTDIRFSIALLQQEMQISRSSLGTYFKKSTGLSPLSYMMGRRLAQAKMLLGETTYPISKVAHASGFKCAVYFSQIITKNTGLSPRAYRYKFQKKDS